LTFEGIGNNAPISNFYAAQGIFFDVNWSAVETGSWSNMPSSPAIASFTAGSGTINHTIGFTAFDFYYATSPQADGTFQIWSGLDGTGTLLASGNLATAPAAWSAWVHVAPSFGGVAHSVVFTEVEGNLGFDNMTFRPIPAPAAALPFALGLLLRRRQKTA
jgi:hypothetical protein